MITIFGMEYFGIFYLKNRHVDMSQGTRLMMVIINNKNNIIALALKNVRGSIGYNLRFTLPVIRAEQSFALLCHMLTELHTSHLHSPTPIITASLFELATKSWNYMVVTAQTCKWSYNAPVLAGVPEPHLLHRSLRAKFLLAHLERNFIRFTSGNRHSTKQHHNIFLAGIDMILIQ